MTVVDVFFVFCEKIKRFQSFRERTDLSLVVRNCVVAVCEMSKYDVETVSSM